MQTLSTISSNSFISYIIDECRIQNDFISNYIAVLWNFFIPHCSSPDKGTFYFIVIIKFVDKIIEYMRAKKLSRFSIDTVEIIALRFHTLASLIFSYHRSNCTFDETFIVMVWDISFYCREQIEELIQNADNDDNLDWNILVKIPLKPNLNQLPRKVDAIKTNNSLNSENFGRDISIESDKDIYSENNLNDISTISNSSTTISIVKSYKIKTLSGSDVLTAFDYFFNHIMLAKCFKNNRNKPRLKPLIQKLAWFSNERIEHMIRIEMDVSRGVKPEKMSYFYPKELIHRQNNVMPNINLKSNSVNINDNNNNNMIVKK